MQDIFLFVFLFASVYFVTEVKLIYMCVYDFISWFLL